MTEAKTSVAVPLHPHNVSSAACQQPFEYFARPLHDFQEMMTGLNFNSSKQEPRTPIQPNTAIGAIQLALACINTREGS